MKDRIRLSINQSANRWLRIFPDGQTETMKNKRKYCLSGDNQNESAEKWREGIGDLRLLRHEVAGSTMEISGTITIIDELTTLTMTNPHYYHNPRRRPTADAPHSACCTGCTRLTNLSTIFTEYTVPRPQATTQPPSLALGCGRSVLCGMDYFRCQHT